jgi:hypothetical protein
MTAILIFAAAILALCIVYAAGAKHGQEMAKADCEAVHVRSRIWALIEPGRKLYHVAERHLLGHPEFHDSDLHRAWLIYDEEYRKQYKPNAPEE